MAKPKTTLTKKQRQEIEDAICNGLGHALLAEGVKMNWQFLYVEGTVLMVIHDIDFSKQD